MEIIVSQTKSTESDKVVVLFPARFTFAPPHHLIKFFFGFFFSSRLLAMPQIARRNAYLRASELRPDNVCPFQRVWRIGRAMIFLTCRSFVIPQRGRGHGELPWRRSALSPSQSSLASTQTFFLPSPPSALLPLEIQNSWWGHLLAAVMLK